MSSEDWYLESIRRGGTHYGRLENGTVHAVCGVEFTPQADLFLGSGVAVAVLPMQSGQGCSDCIAHYIAQLQVPVGDVEARSTGGTWVRRQPGATIQPAAPPVVVTAAPPAVEEVTAAPMVSGDSWFRRSTKPGDTHWVTTVVRSRKIAACGATFGGKQVKNPTPTQICSTCDKLRRPR